MSRSDFTAYVHLVATSNEDMPSVMSPLRILVRVAILSFVTGLAKTWHNVARTEIHFIA